MNLGGVGKGSDVSQIILNKILKELTKMKKIEID